MGRGVDIGFGFMSLKNGIFVEKQMYLEHGTDTWVCTGVCLIPMAETQVDQEEENEVEAGPRTIILASI